MGQPLQKIRTEALDWLAEAEADLTHASQAYNLGSYNWACFAAEQAAEKAVKAFLIGIVRRRPFHIHDLTALQRQTMGQLRLPPVVSGRLAQLSAYYTTSRYPNSGLVRPSISITSIEARSALNISRMVVRLVKREFAKRR
jgi:HEPN domain-containing protein